MCFTFIGDFQSKKIAEGLLISENDFKASWQWSSQLRVYKGLQNMLLHGVGGEVDKKNPELLAALEVFCSVIVQYEPECVYNMGQTGLFFCLLPRYTILMPSEGINTTCGKK